MVDLLIVTIVNFQERFIRVRDIKIKNLKKNRIRFLVKTVSKIVYITSLFQLNITGKGIH